MDNIILKKAGIQKLNLEKAYDMSLFDGSMSANLDAVEPVYLADKDGKREPTILDTEKANWEGTKEYAMHWNSIKATLDSIRSQPKFNTAQFPAEYYDLFEKITQDITKLRVQEADFTGLLTQERVNLNFSKSVDLSEFLGFTGQFLENNLAGDSVPLIQQKTGTKGSVKMQGYALGNVRSLEDVLYNLDISVLQEIDKAYVRAFIGKRNDLVWGPMIAITDASGWNAGQTVAADATAGATISEKVYKTINSAIEKLGALYDFQNNQEIDLSRIVLAVGQNVDARKVNRAVNGQIGNSKGINSNRQALEIDQIWMYKGDSFFYGKEKKTYAGIAANKAYLFVPGPSNAPNYTLVKRGLVAVSSAGDALTLGQDKNAKYFIQKSYNDEWYGSSAGNTVIDANTDHVWGYVVEVNLPA